MRRPSLRNGRSHAGNILDGATIPPLGNLLRWLDREGLRVEGFAALLFDFTGHGESDGEESGLPDEVDDLAAGDHLFEDPATLQEATDTIVAWFTAHLRRS